MSLWNKEITEAYIFIVLVQLAGNNRPNQGRVEIYQYGKWWTVCDDSFGTSDAQVVCRMMGYSSRYRYRVMATQTIHGVLLPYTGKSHTVKTFIWGSMEATRPRIVLVLSNNTSCIVLFAIVLIVDN